jgi:hypothetical protein
MIASAMRKQALFAWLAVLVVVGIGVGMRILPASLSWFDADDPPPPGTSAAALVWSPDRATQDWPLPVRPESSGEPPLTTLEPRAREVGTPAEFPFFTDPSGDLEPFAPGWLDITEIRVNYDIGDMMASRVEFDLAAEAPSPFPDPRNRWVAYGMVVDVDGDGQGDLRLGMDNAPRGQHRAWWTDLATGVTSATIGPPYGLAGRFYFDTWLPGEEPFGRMQLMAEDVGEFKFYVWASLIVNGQVVATDYAPNVGWVDPGDGRP